jgi:hypothetical protein
VGYRPNAGGDGCSGTPTGATGRNGGIARVERPSVQRVVREHAHREGWGVGPPDNDCTGLLEVRYDRSILGCDRVTERHHAVVGRTAGLIRVHLNRDRYSVQRAQRVTAFLCGIGSFGNGERFLLEHSHNCVNCRVDGVKA